MEKNIKVVGNIDVVPTKKVKLPKKKKVKVETVKTTLTFNNEGVGYYKKSPVFLHSKCTSNPEADVYYNVVLEKAQSKAGKTIFFCREMDVVSDCSVTLEGTDTTIVAEVFRDDSTEEIVLAKISNYRDMKSFMGATFGALNSIPNISNLNKVEKELKTQIKSLIKRNTEFEIEKIHVPRALYILNINSYINGKQIASEEIEVPRGVVIDQVVYREIEEAAKEMRLPKAKLKEAKDKMAELISGKRSDTNTRL